MKNADAQERSSRREFLLNLGRNSAFASLSALSFALWKQSRLDWNCLNQCQTCALLPNCALPKAAQNRRAAPANSSPAAHTPALRFPQAARFKCPRPDSRGILTGPADALFLVGGKYLTRIDPLGGGIIAEFALRAAPRDAAFGPDGTFFVAFHDHIERFDSSGRRLSVWAKPEGNPWLTALAANPAALFAADAGGRRVLRYDFSGNITAVIGGKGSPSDAPGFVVPSPYFDLAIGRDQLLRVANPGRHQIETYTPEGEFLSAWGQASGSDAGFCGCCNPIHFALLSDGAVATCEKGLPRVKVFNRDGQFAAWIAREDSFPPAADADEERTRGRLDVAADSHDRLFVLDAAAEEIRVYARHG